MPKRHLIIYCDESAEKGSYYSHFYGGALIDAQNREIISRRLIEKKDSLNLFRELKWTYISENYRDKYLSFIDYFMGFVRDGLIKIRIMFTQNIHIPRGLTEYQIDNEYFLLYYQLIKHAFGLRYCNPGQVNDIVVSVFMDDIPDTNEKFSDFRQYMHDLSNYPIFRRSKVTIPIEEITSVRSHDHVIMQGLDIVLGAMQFRLNDKHKYIPKGQRKRGKRTRAKEAVYANINRRIREIYPNFNIGVSTGMATGDSDKWNHPYRHWLFIPTDHEIDRSRGKRHYNKQTPPQTT